MRRILLSLLFAVLLACSFVGMKNLVAEHTGDGPVVMAVGSLPPPPIPQN